MSNSRNLPDGSPEGAGESGNDADRKPDSDQSLSITTSSEVEHSSDVPTVIVDDSAVQSMSLSGQGSTTGTEANMLGPNAAPLESMVQPGRSLLTIPAPPEITGEVIRNKDKYAGGAFADVYRGVLVRPDGTTIKVAIKCVTRKHGANDVRFNLRIQRKTTIWSAASHPNILPFLGHKLVDGVPWLISPWCENGSLRGYISSNKPRITDVQVLRLLLGAGRGAAHVHSLEPCIVHGDIKPENVVIQDNLEAALCDFGVSRIVLGLGKESGLTTTGARVGGTAGYIARETLEGEELPQPSADVYSFGGLILAAISGKNPFWNKINDAGRIVAVCKGSKPEPEDHPGLPVNDSLWALLERCWSSEPGDRPTMLEVMEELEGEITKRQSGTPLC